MPISVTSVFASAGLIAEGSVRWGEDLREQAPGVYVLALTQDSGSATSTLPDALIDSASIDRLLAVRPHIEVDGKHASSDGLRRRLSSFWLPSEPVLYIGQTKRPLQSRLREFYATPIGARSPHAGGWWIKALACRSDIHVHFALTQDFKDCERRMLRYFTTNAEVPSAESGADPHDGMPFANKEWWTENGRRIRRTHGIRYDTSNP